MIPDAEQLRDRLKAAGVAATLDPSWAATNRPCVLIPPPSINYATRGATWRLAALSSHANGSLPSWEQLHDLVERCADVLDVELAEPASYALTPETGAVPAYLLTVTTSH